MVFLSSGMLQLNSGCQKVQCSAVST